MPYGFEIEDPNDKFHLMAKPFMEAFKILVTKVIKPENWERVPDMEFHQEVIFKIKVALQAHTQPNPMNLTYLFGNNTYSSQYQYLLGVVPPKCPYNYRTQADCPANWIDKPIKGFPNYPGDQILRNPLKCSDDAIAFNLWIVGMADLQKARYYILAGIKELVQYLTQSRMRDLIDFYEDDLKHYFYHHCHIFRFMENNIDPRHQGFTCQCLHYDYKTPVRPYPLRQAFRPHNPLLNEEEDEFLHHASRIFQQLKKAELTNAIRFVQGTIPFMADEASILFK